MPLAVLPSPALCMAVLVLAAATARAERVDVAPTGTASQTSEWNGGEFPAYLAIDGDPQTFNHTDGTPANNSWRLLFDGDHEIARLEIAMRDGCCGGRLSGATVRLFDSEGDSVYSATLNDPGPGQIATFEPPGGVLARSLRIGFENGATNPGSTENYVHLAEVRVLAEIELLPVIAAFAAFPSGIAAGGSCILSWQTDGADAVELIGTGMVDTTGSTEVAPAASEIFTLIASNARGSRSASVAVLVDGSAFPPRVTEFMAVNGGTITRSDGSTPDWIEIWNPNPHPVDLSGYRLTDDPESPARFVFPETVLPAGSYLVIDADPISRDGVPATGFGLKGSSGHLALRDPDGQLLQAFTYPGQRAGLSYGVDWNGDTKYFLHPTPGTAPAFGTADGIVADTEFSVPRGLYDAPQSVAITSATPSATIYTTTDGSEPSPSNPVAAIHSAPITIGTTTVLRAAAFLDHHVPSAIDTQTYLFVDDVGGQPSTPAHFPLAWVPNLSGVFSPVPRTSHFGMDDGVIASLPLLDRAGESFGLREALLAIPTLSLVMDADELFDPVAGIHANAQRRGRAWERRASIEILDPATGETHQADCGIRTHGGWNRFPEMLKKSFRLYFRSGYGDAKLDFPLFPGAPTSAFDRIILRSGNGKSWASPWRDLSGPGNSLERNTYLRDQFVRDLQGEMSGVHVPGRFAHLYVNGHYWGLYNPVERPDEHFASSRFGGRDEDYDVIKWIRGVGHSASAGSDAGWNALVNLARGGTTNPAAYHAIGRLLDLPQFIDYMLLNFYAGNIDWVDNNAYAMRDRANDGPFRFYCWDAEETFLNPGEDATGQMVPDTSTELHQALRANPEYRLLFADRAQKHLFNGGALTRERADASFLRLALETDRAIVGDSARWGNLLRPSHPYDRGDWFAEVENIRNNYLGSRPGTTLAQLRALGLFPAVGAPVFSPQRGGAVPPGFLLVLAHPPGQTGSIYYTTDGSDPRLAGGGVSPAATAFSGVPREEFLVPAAATWRYLDTGADLGTSAEVEGSEAFGPSNWKHPAFDDGDWPAGVGPLGYGSIANTTLQTTVAYGDPLRKHTTTYFRHPFTATGASRFSNLRLRLMRDDGAVVYLNGREIARSGFPSGVATVTAATFALEATGNAEGVFHEFPLPPSQLAEGANLLAVEVHQSSLTSSDLGFDLTLSGDALPPGSAGITFDGGTLVRARARVGSQWSALDEALFLAGDRAHDLHVSEIMFHPAAPVPGEAEFVEIANRGAAAHSLGDLRLIGGIAFDFAAAGLASLPPGGRLLLVRNASVFAANYPASEIDGTYSGALGNGGDSFSLEQSDGTVLWTLTYDDARPWPDGTDGVGHSLTYVTGDQNAPASWRPSTHPGGSPGESDSLAYDGGDLIAYALLGTTVRLGPDGTPEFHLATRLGADEAEVAPEWSADLEFWHSDSLERVAITPAGDGTATEVWTLAAPAATRLYFRTRVTSR